MKTIGLIGGMSWESSAEYYRLINEQVKARLGGHHSAKSVMVSVDFEDIETMQREDRWDDAGQAMAAAARQCEAAGADFVVLCTNTMHKTTPAIEAALSIPFLHIGDATAAAVRGHGIETVAFLGTRYSMEQDFMTGRLRTHGLDIMLPDEAARTMVHDIIYNELVHGDIQPASRESYQEIIQQMATQGAAGVILGCTEIGLLIQQQHSALPVFDTTQIHAETAVNWAIADTGV
jgi:aspartate racemase